MTNTLDKIIHNGDEYIIPQQKALVITLTSAGWTNNEQTVTATGVTANNSIIVSPVPTYINDYTDAKIYCSAQGTDSLTFTCDTTPASDIEVNVLVLSAETGSGPTPPSPRQPGVNTLAYYHIEADDDTTIHDRAGNNNLSYPSNAYITDANAGKVLNFASTNYASGNVVDMGTEYTEIAWVYWNGGLSGNQTIFSQNADPVTFPSTGINIENGNLIAISAGNYTTNIPMPQGTWTMICWTRNSNGDMKLYLNGVHQTTVSSTNTPDYSSGEGLYIGLWRLTYYQPDGYFKTLILEDKERDASEVSSYYVQTKGDFGIL